MTGEKKFIIAIIVSSILFLILIINSSNNQNERLSQPLFGTSEEIQGQKHVERGQITETQDPPTSGDHYGDGVAGAGIHDEPVEDGLTVHSMEHGAVVLHYDPNQLNTTQIEQLKDIFTSKFNGKKIMLPRLNMSAPIVMTSWGQILKLDEIDQEQMVTFMDTNNDRGPEKVSQY